jgi:hypothetical protein
MCAMCVGVHIYMYSVHIYMYSVHIYMYSVHIYMYSVHIYLHIRSFFQLVQWDLQTSLLRPVGILEQNN